MESDSGPKGKPPEWFLIDPPKVVDFGTNGLDLPHIGQKIIAQPCYDCQGTGFIDGALDRKCKTCLGAKVIHHIADRIGRKYYKTIPHFVEEVRYLGASRKLNPKGDYSRLRPGVSRMMFAHDLAIPARWDSYYEAEPSSKEFYVPRCPKSLASHIKGQEPCIRFTYQDLYTQVREETQPGFYTVGPFNEDTTVEVKAGTRQRIVTLPCGGPFYGLIPPKSELEFSGQPSHYLPGFFMWLPISRLVVIEDPENGSHKAVLKSHKGGSLPIEVVKE